MHDKAQPFMLPLSAAQVQLVAEGGRTALNRLAFVFCSPLPPATSCRDWPRRPARTAADVVIDSRLEGARGRLGTAPGRCHGGRQEGETQAPVGRQTPKNLGSRRGARTGPGVPPLLGRTALALVNGAPQLGRGWSGPVVGLLEPGQKGKAALHTQGDGSHGRVCEPSHEPRAGKRRAGHIPHSPARRWPSAPARGSDARGLPGRAVPSFSPARVLRGTGRGIDAALARDGEVAWVPAVGRGQRCTHASRRSDHGGVPSVAGNTGWPE